MSQSLPKKILNWINGEEFSSNGHTFLDKKNPHTGVTLSSVICADITDVDLAVASALHNQKNWAQVTPIARGQHLFAIAEAMTKSKQDLADIVALETGKPMKDALGEVMAATAQAYYYAGEGARLFANSLTSGLPNKFTHSVRQARGVAGLIVPANTPIANIAWKLFPALICGNGVVLKASEDAPYIANYLVRLAESVGLPKGLVNVVQGPGHPVGARLVEHPDVSIISFTGSTAVGRWIAETAGRRLARVSLELGGKNPFVVCDDADLEQAAHWAVLSAYSNAGQRCAAGSRIIVMRPALDNFLKLFLAKVQSLRLGVGLDDDLGPVINQRQQANILTMIARAKEQGGKILCGGSASSRSGCKDGYYIEPTLISDLLPDADLCVHEAFGPLAVLQVVNSYQEAVDMANATEFGLTAAIHTASIDRATHFTQHVRAGVVNVNLGTYGSEPHMPFGGFGASGNGTREPGLQALDVYSELKNISFYFRNQHLN